MNPQALESDYMTLCQTLEAKVTGLVALCPAIQGFWTLWCKEHRNVAQGMGSRELSQSRSQEADPRWAEFMKRRQRMVSALGQGLKSSGTSEELRQSVQQLLAEHDRCFVDLLQKELERVKVQMTAAFAVKRTVSAYAQTAQFRGE
ncbi:MAG: hypothetical protein FJY29_08700 [Betaproteobacteria bacterium]|nr:hypothetical protein [Betaproteobacteria bacterium]